MILPGPSESDVVALQTKHISTLSMSPGSDTVENADLIWGETDDGPNREWSKLDNDFTNAGYREGITAGKESALQEGFDEGFAQVGAPLGREIGLLRGVANAAIGFVSSQVPHVDFDVLEQRKNEIRSIIGSLGHIHLEDLAPQDLQAEEHAKEHMDPGKSSGALISSSVPIDNAENYQVKPAVEELYRLRMRLSNVLQEIGLDIPLV